MSERERRLAENEVAFREINERLRDEVEAIAGADATFNVLCECSSPACAVRIKVTPAEYESIHADAAQFIVALGHSAPVIETVVGGTDLYDVVRKRGEAADVARAADESSQ